MNNILTFLANNDYKVTTFELADTTAIQFTKNRLFLTFETYFVHSICFDENSITLLLQNERADKEVHFDSENACINCLEQLIAHEQKTKFLLEQLQGATM